MSYSARGGSGYRGRNKKGIPRLRRHHVTVRETEKDYVLDGGIHIPKDMPGAKAQVAAYVDHWDVDAGKREELYNKRIDRYGQYLKKKNEDFDHEIVNGMKRMTLRQNAPDVERGAFIRNQIVDEFLNGRFRQSKEMYERELAVAQRYMEDHYTDPFFVGTQVYEWDWKAKDWKKATSGKYEDSHLGW